MSATCRALTVSGEGSDTGLQVALSERFGVAGIFFRPGFETPEGVGIGSTLDEWMAAYPDTGPPDNAAIVTPVPGHPGRQYHAFVDEDATVVSMTLELDEQDCYR